MWEQIGIPEPHNLPDVNVVRVGESMTDVTDKSEFVETRETEPVDKAGWIIRRISELGGYENVDDSAKVVFNVQKDLIVFKSFAKNMKENGRLNFKKEVPDKKNIKQYLFEGYKKSWIYFCS